MLGEEVHFELKARPIPKREMLLFVTATLVSGLAALGTGGAFAWLSYVEPQNSQPRSGLVVIAAAVYLFVASFRAAQRRHRLRKGLPPLRFGPDAFLGPAGPISPNEIRVPYETVESLYITGGGLRRRILIDTPSGLIVYPFSIFGSEQAAAEMVLTLRARIAALTSGTERLEEINRRTHLARLALQRRTPATRALLMIIGVVFAIEIALGATDDPFGLIRLGANARVLIDEGQIYRLITANFLHGNLLHIGMNGLALMVLGMMVERLAGTARFWLVYFSSSIAGSFASMLAAPDAFSVGASTALFGLLGALLALSIRYRNRLPGGFRRSPSWWISILALNAALPILVPQIDVWAHVGGFFAGAIVMSALLPGRDPLQLLSRPPGPIVIGLGYVCVAVTTLACAQGALEAARADEDADLPVMARLIEREDMDAESLNALAWHTAEDPDASKARLEIALRAAERAHATQPSSRGIRDTLATLHFRLGDFDRAITLERTAVAGANPQTADGVPNAAFYASQLARFERARASESGLPLVPGLDLEQIGLTRIDDALELRLGSTIERAIDVRFVLENRDGLWAHGELLIPPSEPSTLRIPLLECGLSAPPGDASVITSVGWAAVRPEAMPGRVRCHAQPQDPEVRALPPFSNGS